jgi:hypothetical protein
MGQSSSNQYGTLLVTGSLSHICGNAQSTGTVEAGKFFVVHL